MPAKKKEVAVSVESLIARWAEMQLPKTELCDILGISTDTFDRREELRQLYAKHKSVGRSKLREKLFLTAMSGNTSVLIFLAKSMLGLKETSAMELSGPDGKPIEIDNARERLANLLAGISLRQPAPADPEPAD